ncbi:MAG: hypothetical protein EAZ20_13645 [Bacteroidetes bacterium]|nr:MAG: hypothetical protein EAZ20_13645 [Bacteroidota bacterium]
MSETNIGFHYLYHAAREFYEKKDFNKAFDFYKAALLNNGEYAVVWQEAGYTLMRLQRMAEAGVYFRKALIQYEQNENTNIPKDKKFYLKACLHAILEEKEESIRNLKEALALNPQLKHKVKEESDFNAFLNDDFFIELLKEEQQELNQLNLIQEIQSEVIDEFFDETKIDVINETQTEVLEPIEFKNDKNNTKTVIERGNKLKKSELSDIEISKRNIITEILKAKNWVNNDLEIDFENDIAIAPQILLFYPNNPNFEMQLSYYIEENFIFLDLLSKNQRTESQTCKLKANNLGELIEKIILTQDTLNDDNWTDFLGEVIDICEEVTLQMADGRQVKL